MFFRKGITVYSNRFDLRVVIVGNRAIGEKRYCRKGDFRASGSGIFEYSEIRDDVLEVAFDTARKLRLQSVAFDFMFKDNRPVIVEMSYGFGTHGISHAKGYYTLDLQWHEEAIDLQAWIVDSMIAKQA